MSVRPDGVEFRALLDMLMVTDPWHDPCFLVLEKYADRASRSMGYEDWIDAYHKHREDYEGINRR